jgi:GWxTD domain-containing protein
MNTVIHFFDNPRRVWTLLLFYLAIPLLASGSQTEQPSPDHRKWLEEEVVYIITDREKEVFLTLEAFEDRERFIRSFWDRRDPNRATPENEFKEEHYRRLEYANLTFSKYTSRPGWKTDQGRMYIILGKPRERKLFEAYQYLVYCDLWFYQGDISKGLPNFFYLLFRKQHDVGEYKLYSPYIDGPLSLVRGEPGFSNDSAEAIKLLLDVSTDLAHASLSFDTSDSPDFYTGRPSMGAEMVIPRIVESPKRAIRTDYADAWLRYGKKVSADYSFNFVPSRAIFTTLLGPMGAPFLHYSIEIDPSHFVLETDETKYYTTLDVTLEVTDQDGRPVVARDKEVYVELTESEIQQFNHVPFAYQDDFPIVPGEYTVTVILRNRVVRQYAVAEHKLKVEQIPPSQPGIAGLILGFRSEQMVDNAKEGELRTFQVGKVRIHPAVENTFTLGETVHVLAQVLETSSEHQLKLALLDAREETLFEKTAPLGTEQAGAVLDSFPLTEMTGGRYQIRGQLLAEDGTVLAEKSVPFQVSPRTAITRPWVHRRSFDTGVPGLLPLTLGDQLLALDQIELAQRALEVAVAANNPDLPQAGWRLAGIYVGWREPDRALELLLPLEDEYPNQYEVVAGLGFAFYFKKSFDRAAGYLERAATIRAPGTSLLNTLGECHQELGDRAKAKQFYERSIELNPDQEEIKKKLVSIGATAGESN